MNEVRTISVIISLIVLILNANMCLAQYSDYTDFSTNVLNNPAELIKSLINEEVASNITGRSARLTSYIMHLYNALADSGEAQRVSSHHYPKIRSFRGLTGGEGTFMFQLPNVWNSRVKRVEIAINLDRTRQDNLSGHRYQLFVHGATFGTVEYVSQTYSSYIIFDITDLKETMPSNISIDRFLNMYNGRVRISRLNEPLLLVYENLRHNPLLNEEYRVQRQKRHVESIFGYNAGEVNRRSCRRINWDVDLSIFPGLDWWLYPRMYNAGYCAGECRFPLTRQMTNSTSYSFLKSVWHSQTFFLDEVVPRAHCVPVDYEPLQIIHLTNNLEQDIMLIDNMIVKSCGCR